MRQLSSTVIAHFVKGRSSTRFASLFNLNFDELFHSFEVFPEQMQFIPTAFKILDAVIEIAEQMAKNRQEPLELQSSHYLWSVIIKTFSKKLEKAHPGIICNNEYAYMALGHYGAEFSASTKSLHTILNEFFPSSEELQVDAKATPACEIKTHAKSVEPAPALTSNSSAPPREVSVFAANGDAISATNRDDEKLNEQFSTMHIANPSRS